MAIPPEDERRHREFGDKARAELVEHWRTWSAEDVGRWWYKWCRFGMATHDVLGRALIDVTEVKPKFASELTPEESEELGLNLTDPSN